MVTQTNGGLCEVANKHARKKKTRDDPDSNPDSWRSSLVGVQADSHIFETASLFGKKISIVGTPRRPRHSPLFSEVEKRSTGTDA